jgi:hypothetical protein
MIRTQVQLPDELYRAAKELAAREERSLAEVVRRGLECLLARHPEAPIAPGSWRLPSPANLDGDDFLDDPDWRFLMHHQESVREEKSAYGAGKRNKKA